MVLTQKLGELAEAPGRANRLAGWACAQQCSVGKVIGEAEHACRHCGVAKQQLNGQTERA